MKLVNDPNKSCCYFAFRSNLRSRWTSPAVVLILISALPIVKPAACVGPGVPRAGKKSIPGLLRTPVVNGGVFDRNGDLRRWYLCRHGGSVRSERNRSGR